MKKDYLEKLLNKLLSTGADFAEIYEETDHIKSYGYIDSKLDKISDNTTNGVGLRIANGNEIYYGFVSQDNLSDIDKLAKELTNNISSDTKFTDVKLDKLTSYDIDCKIKYQEYDENLIKILKNVTFIMSKFSNIK